MNRILLLVDHPQNRRLLTADLVPRHTVLQPDPQTPLPEEFDLAIVDGPCLKRLKERIQEHKEGKAVFTPVLFLTALQEHSDLPPEIWLSIDEIITMPVERVELRARIGMLLRARDFSLELRAQRDALQRRYEEQEGLQRELLRRNATLEELNQQKNQWLGMAAHDLRTPLGVISGYSDFLLEQIEESFIEQTEMIDRIKSSSRFMLNLVDDLLDISAIESGNLKLRFQPTDLLELVHRNMLLNRLLAERKKIDIQLRAPDSLPTMELDGDKIEQVLNNLIGNAVKFSPVGTTVQVCVDADADQVSIVVADQGPGIPEDQRQQLFQPFARASVVSADGEKSTGLGLAIVRRIVEGHGGSIRVGSEADRGLTLYISLPLRAELAAEAGVEKEESPASAPRRDTFDREAALQRCGGDLAVLKQHASAFHAECSRLLTDIGAAIAHRGSRSLSRAAYRLSWSLGQLSAGAALDLALQLEKMGREEKLDGAAEVYGALQREIEKLHIALTGIDSIS